MTDVEPPGQTTAAAPRVVRSVVVVGVILAALAILIATKGQAESPAAGVTGRPTTSTANAAGRTITTAHNDAVADYEAALETGKPIYVLFHSLTCEPCVEISAIADEVLPAYKDRVVFVNVITDDPTGRELATRFSFQYIPTSFFLKADGTVTDSFTGVLADADMRARLDALIAR